MSALLLVATLGSSCAYYNTYYLARKYYDRASPGQPYAIDRPEAAAAQNYQKSIDYSRKVLANYPKSKWVDDAYLLWGRALIGRDDPLLAVDLLQAFPIRYPKSGLKEQAKFYLGVAYRHARKYEAAEKTLDTFLVVSPKSDLAPFAYLERSRALMSLDRPAEAAQAASQVVERFGRSELVGAALESRAEARFASRDFAGARADFQTLGTRSHNDEERFSYLLREADCFEGARQYDQSLALLRDAISHERRPSQIDTTGALLAQANEASASMSRYARLLTRIGTAHLLAGRLDQALPAYHEVVTYFPRTLIAAEAQYRIGYAYEIGSDDFDTARNEYAKVKDQGAGSAFAQQASQRMENLDRIARYRSAGGDSLDKHVEAGFLLAEQYLFELDKPDRALTEYRKIALEYPGTPYAGKALNAEAWMLRHKFEQPRAADSVLWVVVHDYPRTEAQLAARDFLESAGHTVPDSLIQLPTPTVTVSPDTGVVLTHPPDVQPLGITHGAMPIPADSLARMRAAFPRGFVTGGTDSLAHPTFSPFDSLKTASQRDTVLVPPPPPTMSPRDSLRRERR
jgi:TolA-binding protein